MEVKEHQIFNLWDTNGRRGDVLNAIQIYLGILQDLNSKRPNEMWGAYPGSLKQFLFYKDAIASSPEIFKDHSKFDLFNQQIDKHLYDFLAKRWNRTSDKKISDNLDQNIEARARHYTSNLVRLGFATEDRSITQAGFDFLANHVERDAFESLLPVSDISIVLLRQLMKLKIYGKPDEDGKRQYYSPFFMAIFLMLQEKPVDKDVFKYVVQGSSPYWNKAKSPKEILQKCRKFNTCLRETEVVPTEFQIEEKIDGEVFASYIKNRKSSDTVEDYYVFYSALYEFVNNRNQSNFRRLRNIIVGDNSDKLRKAFGCGESIFNMGNKTRLYELEEFLLKNDDSPFLCGNLNEVLYRSYSASKYIDQAREYSDTTIRLLGATGLFKFSKALPELNFKVLFSQLLSRIDLESKIFGVVDSVKFADDESSFLQNLTTLQIIGLSENKLPQVCRTVSREELEKQNKTELERHIEEKYPRERTLEILRMFSDRDNDAKIKKAVNDEAPVPTIYEYMVAVAWYYISGKTISVYDSLNLTLNGDMEPVVHASGGSGDIVVDYPKHVVMLEVTLMNASAQKRGEWEPVLRHSINLNAETERKTVITLFIADVLDYNTINIWRAVSMVPLQASNSEKMAEKVTVAAFRNDELCDFLENEVRDVDIIHAVEKSFATVKFDFDTRWRGDLLSDIRKEYHA